MTTFLPSPFWFIVAGVSAICLITVLVAIHDYPSRATMFIRLSIIFACIFLFCLGAGFRAPNKIVVVEVPNKCIENAIREYFKNLPDTNKYDLLMINK